MDTILTYNVPLQETFGVWIAVYFYLTGLSAGSFILSTLRYVFGFEQFKPLAKPGVVLAALLLILAPIALLVHSGQPLKAWHLFVFINPSSPLSWGSFLLTIYPIISIIYAYFMFKENKKWAKIMGIIGIPSAIAVHGYTGFVLSVAKARALWATPIMPLLFLVSAIISGIAMMMIVNVIQGYFFTKEKKINTELLFTLGKMLIWIIVFDLFLVFCDVITHYTGHKEGMEVVKHMFTGTFGFLFLVAEVLIGKVIPLAVFSVPKWKKTSIYLVMAIIIMIGIFIMRYNVVVGGEHIPII